MSVKIPSPQLASFSTEDLIAELETRGLVVVDHTELLRTIAGDGPFLRGSEEWNKREFARRAIGCHCISIGRL